jgi:hypothetical protein
VNETASAPDAPRPLPVAATLAPREILSAAWPLFKASVPVCLPLAVVGVAAGATPGAEAGLSEAGRMAAYTREWWGLTAASTLLTLICYGAVLRQQSVAADGKRQPVLESLRRAAVDLPAVLVILLALVIPVVPAMLATAWRGFDVLAGLLTLVASGVLVFGWFAWLEVVARGASPLAAIGHSVRLVRGRWRTVAMVAFSLVAAVFVFVLLTAIFIGMVMEMARQGAPEPAGLAFSRWLMAVILATPIVYGGAVTVSAWRALRGAG